MRLRYAILAFLAGTCGVSGIDPRERICVDQVGFRPGDPKIAFLQETIPGDFEVLTADSGNVVFRGTVGTAGFRDRSTGDQLFPLDFTSVNAPGRYRIRMDGGRISSRDFRIGEDVYAPVLRAALRSFYFQRCGTAIGDGTSWSHPACHTAAALMYDDTSVTADVRGGWHDAGDYNRFTPTTAVSAEFLLSLYDLRPGMFTDGQTEIPESGNGIPDILDEVRWALEWLLRMQDPGGGVFHKVSIREWTGEHLPHEEADQLYVFRVSSAATGAAAAVAAHGSRIFRVWDPPFALSLMSYAVRAWRFLEAHPALVPPGGFRNPAGVSGGEYGDTDDSDERLWAAVELYRLTGDEKYHRYFLTKHRETGGFRLAPSWRNVLNFALSGYLDAPGANAAARGEILSLLAAYGNILAGRTEGNGYRCALSPDEFYWGSNSVALGYAYDLVRAHMATGDDRFLRAAIDQIHYLLGRNAFNICFVTGTGGRPVERPYHQFSMMLRGAAPVPGMVVGGPNSGSNLGGARLSEYPGRCYEDNHKNYYVNEPAINYTAPLVFLAGYLSPAGSRGAAEGRAYGE